MGERQEVGLVDEFIPPPTFCPIPQALPSSMELLKSHNTTSSELVMSVFADEVSQCTTPLL